MLTTLISMIIVGAIAGFVARLLVRNDGVSGVLPTIVLGIVGSFIGGFLGYLDLGYTRRDVELFVWLEALRDKQCAEAPCELGVLLAGHREPQGGCPVQIHIPKMFELIGNGRFREALEMLESCNPLPNVTGRVCPQEVQCQEKCTVGLKFKDVSKAVSIGRLERFVADRADLVAQPDRGAPRGEGVPPSCRRESARARCPRHTAKAAEHAPMNLPQTATSMK